MGFACHYKHEAVSRLLARRGAYITKRIVDTAKAQGKRKLAKWLRRVYGHATSLHWACEDRDREGLLRRLRSDEYERALPPLAALEAIATHKHAPRASRACGCCGSRTSRGACCGATCGRARSGSTSRR